MKLIPFFLILTLLLGGCCAGLNFGKQEFTFNEFQEYLAEAYAENDIYRGRNLRFYFPEYFEECLLILKENMEDQTRTAEQKETAKQFYDWLKKVEEGK